MTKLSEFSTMPEDVDRGSAGATSLLAQRANEVLKEKINWPSYLQSQMMSQEDFEVMNKLESRGSARETLLLQQRPLVAKTFISLLSHVSKDSTIQYILVLLDELISEDPSRLDMFRENARKHKGENQWTAFLNLLTRPDPFTTHMIARILSKMCCWGTERMEGSDLTFYLTWLKDQLRTTGNEYVQCVCRCLQMLLRIDPYRDAFFKLDGVVTIVQVLGSGKHNFQIQYQLTFCLWVLTFNHEIAEKMNKYGVIPTLGDILSESVKEKVTRITLAVFRNLIEKPQDSIISRDNCIQMVQCKVLKQLEILAQHKFDDEDITADIEFLNDRLQTSIQDLSSFEEYCSEVKSGRMEWSPVHKSEKFWRENCHRLNEKNYELLKILIQLMETSTDPLVLSVACHDIGQYSRHYAAGKKVLEQLDGKQCVMAHLSHSDPNVRYEALLAVQKLMVHNWEYLGKQIEKESEKP
ncbi:Atp6v1h [Hyalella azteca]|uniref:V-type proton ATPase subunit H n=1 Tax=Hyalella azteca TaxID=294128 RepID=A0A6A0GUN1_HYAAZ|nr:V-type proton ATPase subunit H isoform X2 [Hyalella azteca]KAA0188880.1 Atp6v1h [Hyalella azteca]